MTATAPAWMTDTGPLDFHDVQALRRDPYLRDAAGRFATHHAELPARVESVAGGAAVVSYDGESSFTAVRVIRDQTGRIHVTYPAGAPR